jgi:hypothetical protein
LRSQFDQQPIEATAMILAAAAAHDATRDDGYRRTAEAAYGWFLGDNDCGLAVADTDTGGCRDGLSEDHVNENQGAESTLMWLTALETIRLLRTRAMAVVRFVSRTGHTRPGRAARDSITPSGRLQRAPAGHRSSPSTSFLITRELRVQPRRRTGRR